MMTPIGKNAPSRPCVSLEHHELLAASNNFHQMSAVLNFQFRHPLSALLFNITEPPSSSPTSPADPGQLLYTVPILRAKCILNT